MKKLILIMVIAIAALGLAACKTASQNKTSGENPVTEKPNRIVSNEDSIPEETDKNVSDEVNNSEENDSSEQENGSDSAGKTVLVVYFSVTGNTKTVAEKIASVTDADIYEIKAAKEYTDEDINYSNSKSRTSKEQNDSSVRPEIQGKTISLEGYDTIYIGYPIWWGEEPRILDTFVESYDFGEITMVPFCTSGSSGIGNSGKNLAKNAGGGKWLEGKRFSNNVSESDIKAWISGLSH